MKRVFLSVILLAAALTGCKIGEAESFVPTYNGLHMFQPVNDELRDAVADAMNVFLFDLYYSAPKEERETIHNRHFYTSHIYNTGNEWHIVDTNREIIICTGGKSLSEAGATWRFRYSDSHYSNDDMIPTLTSCAKKGVVYHTLCYDYKSPENGALLTLEPRYMCRDMPDGTMRYWMEAYVEGFGKCSNRDYPADIEEIEYEITRALQYTSEQNLFREGVLKLTTCVEDEKMEAVAKYFSEGDYCGVSIVYNGFKKDYQYLWR